MFCSNVLGHRFTGSQPLPTENTSFLLTFSPFPINFAGGNVLVRLAVGDHSLPVVPLVDDIAGPTQPKTRLSLVALCPEALEAALPVEELTVRVWTDPVSSSDLPTRPPAAPQLLGVVNIVTHVT